MDEVVGQDSAELVELIERVHDLSEEVIQAAITAANLREFYEKNQKALLKQYTIGVLVDQLELQKEREEIRELALTRLLRKLKRMGI